MAIITDKTSVQQDAAKLLSAMTPRKTALIKKFGNKRISDIANGLNAIARLKNTDIKDQKTAQALKLVTIKAQEILKGDEDVLLGAADPRKKLTVRKKLDPKTKMTEYTTWINKGIQAVNWYKAYVKKYPKDTWGQGMLKASQTHLKNLQLAVGNPKKIDSSKIDPSVFNIPPDKQNLVKLSTVMPKKTTEKNFFDDIKENFSSYLPYIVMATVFGILIFSQTKPRTPVRK